MNIIIVIVRHELGLLSLFHPRLIVSLKVFQVYLLINVFINTCGMRVAFTYFLSFEMCYKYYRLF